MIQYNVMIRNISYMPLTLGMGISNTLFGATTALVYSIPSIISYAYCKSTYCKLFTFIFVFWLVFPRVM